ncbi:Cytidine/deoxycytidylate deaminase family protein [Hibiscus syriacus]|uniref:Cytidine/deoxycytidylate deaminase family protein n=1 Tax=Hibiscus syriacus TaxID=106335 RepID=A0A6A3BE89_HIBSY|nr:Cytidine/deoxycytidylate deaminase family protein [Hibiscus syriacus]
MTKVVSPLDSWIWRGILNNYVKNDEIGDCLRANSKIQVGNVDDFLGWSGKGDGLFSVKSCRLTLSCSSEDSFEWNKWVWSGLAPPRVETFLWQLSHRKLAVRVELKKRGIPLDDVLCPLCHTHEEAIEHLFLDCSVAGELWIKFLRCLKIGSLTVLLYSSSLDLGWLNGDLLATPPPDMFKFNVDGAVRGDGLQGGIGGILKDSNCSTLTTFSYAVGPGPPTLSKLKAIKEGIDFFFASDWAMKGRLIIESDCKSVVDWISKQHPAPTFYSSLVEEIGAIISAMDIFLRLILRSCNMEANKLAKEEIGQSFNAALIVDPLAGQIIARACDDVCSWHMGTNEAKTETCHIKQSEGFTSDADANRIARDATLISNGSSNNLLKCDTTLLLRGTDLFRDSGHGEKLYEVDSTHFFSLRFSSKETKEVKVGEYLPSFVPNSTGSISLSDVNTEGSNSLPRPYLCTGYDIYLVWEPCTMCAMALVHQRIRRIFFALPNPEAGALGSVHRLQGEKSLNHHYAVFRVVLPELEFPAER